MMRVKLKRLNKRHTHWHFTTDLFNPEKDDAGYDFDEGYLFAHGFGLQFYILWNRRGE